MNLEVIKQMGDEIKKRRELFGFTQQDLAEITKINEKTIRSIEQGKASSKIEYWFKVLDALGLKLNISIKPMSNETMQSI